MRRSDPAGTSEPLDGSGLSVGVVVSDFNSEFTEPMLAAAQDTLKLAGVENVTVVHVAGALELPVASAALAAQHDAVIAIGAVIEGETDHYEHVATQASAGLMRVSLDTGIPIGNALLTVREVAHAEARTRPGPENKGSEAARACVQAAQTLRSLR